jgi:periplasmic divalent cation tolerance protein
MSGGYDKSSNNPSDVLIVFCTCPDSATARRLARQAVDRSLAACANLLPGVESIYRWQGQVESAEEILLLFKCQRPGFDALRAFLTENHPYEVPEVIAVEIGAGNREYLDWVRENSKGADR